MKNPNEYPDYSKISDISLLLMVRMALSSLSRMLAELGRRGLNIDLVNLGSALATPIAEPTPRVGEVSGENATIVSPKKTVDSQNVGDTLVAVSAPPLGQDEEPAWAAGKKPVRVQILQLLSDLQAFGELETEVDRLARLLDKNPGQIASYPTQIAVSVLRYAVARSFEIGMAVWPNPNDCWNGRTPLVSSVKRVLALVTKASPKADTFINGLQFGSAPLCKTWGEDAENALMGAYRLLISWSDFGNKQPELLGLVRHSLARGHETDAVKRLLHSAMDSGLSKDYPPLGAALGEFIVELEDDPAFEGIVESIIGNTTVSQRISGFEGGEARRCVPADWSGFSFTRDKNAVMIGGDPREVNRERIQREFGFHDLAWVGTEFKQRQVRSLCERIGAGGVNFVIILRRFVGHDTDDMIIPACTRAKIPWISVPNGYGRTQIKREIERRFRLGDSV